MTIKVYRIKIEGYVTDMDLSGDTRITPADWPIASLLEAMSGNRTVTETLVDTIEDED